MSKSFRWFCAFENLFEDSDHADVLLNNFTQEENCLLAKLDELSAKLSPDTVATDRPELREQLFSRFF